MHAMYKSLLIFLGAGIGANARYWLTSWVAGRVDTLFPWGTVIVNITGSLLLGTIAGCFWRETLSPGWRLFFVVGLLGGYTTFSAFAYETVDLVQNKAYLLAVGNIILSVSVSIAACAAGLIAARTVTGG